MLIYNAENFDDMLKKIADQVLSFESLDDLSIDEIDQIVIGTHLYRWSDGTVRSCRETI